MVRRRQFQWTKCVGICPGSGHPPICTLMHDRTLGAGVRCETQTFYPRPDCTPPNYLLKVGKGAGGTHHGRSGQRVGRFAIVLGGLPFFFVRSSGPLPLGNYKKPLRPSATRQEGRKRSQRIVLPCRPTDTDSVRMALPSEMKPVTEFRIDLPRVVVVKSAECQAVVQLHTTVCHIQRSHGNAVFFKKAFSQRKIKRSVPW